MRKPGVQKPHCSPWHSANASWSALSSLPVRQALDGLDLAVVDLDAEHEAGARRRAVDQHGAGAADAVLAADVRPGVAEVVAQHVRQRPPRLDGQLAALAVHAHADEVLLAHASSADRSAS